MTLQSLCHLQGVLLCVLGAALEAAGSCRPQAPSRLRTRAAYRRLMITGSSARTMRSKYNSIPYAGRAIPEPERHAVNPLRVVIVDDEDPAREFLRALLARRPDVEVVGEAGDGASAVATIRARQPDVVFLDVQMPVMNGFDVVAALEEHECPPIIFVTAYDAFALRAFEVNACDYLLKPFDAARLTTAMMRVFDRVPRQGAVKAALRSLVTHVGAAARAAAPIVVKVDGSHIFLAPDEIEWVEAAGKEVRVHLGATRLLVRESLNSLEERLDRSAFIRVHRAALVNRNGIRQVQPWFKGDYVILTRNGTRIVTGRTYRARVRELLGI